MSQRCPHLNKALDMEEPISRWDFLGGATAVRVEYQGEPTKSEFVWITYTNGGKAYLAKPRSVVMAAGGWMTTHVVRALSKNRAAAYGQFLYSPYMAANVAVRNWRFLSNMGISGGNWFGGFGRFVEVRKAAKFETDSPVVGPDLPTVLTFFIDFTKPGLPPAQQGHRRIRNQMTEMFGGSGFDAKGDIAGIIFNRFGHAFINPQPGFFFGLNGQPAAQDALRNSPYGRIAFSHSDLSGAMNHRNAFMQSNRAVSQLLDRVPV